MPLSTHQKSIYLNILNATMIQRSIALSYNKDKERLNRFRRITIDEFENLIPLIDNDTINFNDILISILQIKKKCRITIGQAQKGINVLIKCYFYLYKNGKIKIKKELHCPLDSRVLTKLGYNKLRLNHIIKKDNYIQIQQDIYNHESKPETKIDFDTFWDEENLKRNL